MTQTSDTRPPLKDPPLPNPGESAERMRTDLLLDGVASHFMIATFGVGILIPTLPRLFGYQAEPIWLILFALFLIAHSVWRIARTVPSLRHFRQGIQGEKAVGQFLDRLRSDGAQVFHDIPASGFNLDHVVIHRTGVYLIETKTYSKPLARTAKVVFDGESVLVDGRKTDRNPITQVRAGARWLDGILRESTGRSFPIRPVVVFPGWWVEPTAEAKSSDVWVLNPKALPSFIKNSRDRLPSDEVSLCAFHLSRYIRGAVK